MNDTSNSPNDIDLMADEMVQSAIKAQEACAERLVELWTNLLPLYAQSALVVPTPSQWQNEEEEDE